MKKTAIMKWMISLSLLLAVQAITMAQIFEPVKWKFDQRKVGDNVYELVMKATIEQGWHLYSQNIPDDGPVPTSFMFDENDQVEFIGKVAEPKAHEEYDANFDMTLRYFGDEAEFVQKVKIKGATTITGYLEFMCCDDSKCLPPETIDFEFALGEGAAAAKKDVNKTTPVTETAQPNDQPEVKKEEETGFADVSPEGTADKSLLWIFLAGFVGGLIALITPCVWPMIPMTVSFFIKRSDKKGKGIRDAVIYGISIIVIYVTLGLSVTLVFGADKLNEISTSAIFNLIFFVILVVFAAAFFGAFELTLPSKWTNAMDSKADKTSGLMSIFFMAFTLVLVSFSCTGPIIGTLLVEAVTKGALAPLIGMTGFALALAIPFTIFAIFPSWLGGLPKSGGWLNAVKVVLGFLELALALKFLSNADLAYHWGILDREVFLVLWIVIFAMLGFYLLGKLKFAHDSDLPYISVPRLFLATVSLAFAIYMVPGLWGAPLKAISAFSPPQFTQDFDLSSHQVHAKFDDYDAGMEYARKTGKPVMVDFTGWGCVNCRNMEAAVWTNPQVAEMLTEDYVLISLYVDDKTALPEEDKKTVEFGGKKKKLRTIGNKWSHLQASRFGTNSQPYYVLLDNQGELLEKPRAYDLDVQKYINFLETGLKEYKKRK